MTGIGQVMAAVPRSLFVPPVVWADLGPGPWERVDREADPAKWAGIAEAEISLVTQFDDGEAEGPGRATSSSSMPSMVAAFLHELDVREGCRVLEIGTGTGWTAALLCRLAGRSGHVTTVETDPQLTQQAAAALEAADYAPEVIAGDGAEGYAPGAPYDRVHATCAVRDIPRAWITQVQPGVSPCAPTAPGSGTATSSGST